MKTRTALVMHTRLSAVLAALLFVGVLVANALANALPINGVTTGELSDAIPNLFVPAGLTFSIWGLIYALLAGYMTMVLVLTFRKEESDAWSATDGALFSVNMATNIGWILAWQYRHVAVSMALMVLILVSLLWLEERNHARAHAGSIPPSRIVRFFLTAPINVYLGWICVATIANATALLVTLGWNGFGLDPRIWTVIVIVAALAAGLFLALYRGAIAAPLVIVWAFAGIALNRIQTDMAYSGAIWIAAIASAAVLLAVLCLRHMLPLTTRTDRRTIKTR